MELSACQVTTGTIVTLIVLIISCTLFGVSFSVCDVLEMCLDTNTITKTVDTTNIYFSGRYFLGLGHSFIIYPRNFSIIDFSPDPENGGDPLNAGTSDGQTITVEVTLFYRLNSTQLPQLYNKYGTQYSSKFVNVAQSTLKNTCVKFAALQYFNAREVIAETMINDLRVAFMELFASVELLQLRGITLSDAFESQLTQNVIAVQNQQTAELMKQVAVTQSFTQVILAQAQANITELLATANADATLIQQQANADGTKLIVNVQADAYAQLKGELNFTNAQLFQYLWANNKLRQSQPSDTLLVGLDKSGGSTLVNVQAANQLAASEAAAKAAATAPPPPPSSLTTSGS